ncbi:MAG: Gfo/Idh/MocA family oxidoreductase [Sphingomonadales bacterium]|nr:Gfo/Idh/MocA family oxidoreductase [Sphingomonadales bacterium]MDE2569695.1 Gfo/Idh/MocA family oxidoreductase [Sphingomonadales bacterium]
MTTIGLGIVGLGRGFMLTLPALLASRDIRLVAAFDIRPDARSIFAEQFEAQAFDSLDDLVACDEVDAVYIATPHELHAEQAIAALRAGKHVLVEKPMATSVADCIAMEATARSVGKVLVVGPSHGFDAPVQKAAELVASGRYGAPRMVTAFNFTDFMLRPRRPEELDTERGGGVIFSQAAHQIDVVRRIVGRPVSSLRATAGNWDSSRPSEGAYAAFMDFEGGACATLTYSGYAHFDSDELLGWISETGFPRDPETYGEARRKLAALSPEGEVKAKLGRTYGAAGGLSLPPPAPHHEHFGFVLVSCERADLKLAPDAITAYGDSERHVVAIAPPGHPRAGVLAEFAGAIRDERRPVHDGRWGVETMACCAALLESSRTRREIAPAAIIGQVLENDRS